MAIEKRFLGVAALALCSALVLSGCKTTATPGAPGVTPPAGTGSYVGAIASQIESVQKTSAAVCKFIPTAQTIVGIANAMGFGGSAGATTVALLKSQIVAEICAAVTTRKASRARLRMAVRGVPIQGRFVR
jgi:hypothetical protein